MIYKLGGIIYIIGLIGYIINRKSILFMLLALELMLLGVAYLFINEAILLDDIYGVIYALYILVLAGAEAAVGLGLLITFYKRRGSLEYPK
jgi:NADH-ubiquinone oxidoreductase chain 4L